ncbi:rossmann-fold nad (+)-binding protein [Colletotrichum sojae]|uniref:Rossmann-fold nad (+)-binding protein n=1 Tax=Colletotrichum sojae TaxID=2175907 RepID=A0A8H6IQD3_9PEZI|nr:rossmann-fold nad (+)-binding protein [Colletotrichum sojae]
MPCKTRNIDSEERMAATHELEMKHHQHIHQTQMIIRDEDTRRQRVTKQVLTAENSALREKLAEKDALINHLAEKYDETRAELDSVNAAGRDQQTQLKLQARDLANLKAELESLNSMSQESARVLSEKLTLSRELTTLKLELEHLRSQLAHQQTTMAEKLALERQLNMVEVELAAEKRAREQQLELSEGNKANEDELRRKLKEAEKSSKAEKQDKEKLQQELDDVTSVARSGQVNHKVEQMLTKKLREMEKMALVEKQEKERMRKESEVALSEAQAQHEMLEQRVDTLKSKLRNTQEELKAVRSELVHSRPAPKVMADPVARPGSSKAQNTRKRRAEELSLNDMSIGTPDDIARGRRPPKKALEQTLVGEKSLFSITPFLAKSKTLTVDGVAAEEDEEENEADVSYIPLAHAQAQKVARTAEVEVESDVERGAAENRTEELESSAATAKGIAAKTNTKAIGGAKKTRGRPKKALAEASPNMPTQLVSGKATTKSSSPLEQVVEEPSVKELDSVLPAKAEEVPASTSNGVRETEGKKKKRKLAGDSTTLFDDDADADADATNAKRAGKVAHGASRGLGKTHLTMVRNAGAFGKRTFSPLKKDRRGVGASFLA